MNQTLQKLPRVAAFCLLLGLACSGAHAQTRGARAPQIKVVAEEPEYAELYSPVFQVGGGKKFEAKEWLEIETKINVLMAPEPISKTCDQLKVKWYLAVQNPEKSNTFYLLTKEVDYVNIPLNEDIYCSVYLSPASIRRIKGETRYAKKVVEFVGYEIFFNGTEVAAGSNKGRVAAGLDKGKWWKVASPKISLTNVVSLLDKSETPFSHLWWDRYAEVDITKK